MENKYEYFYDHDIEMTHIEKHGVSTFEIAAFFEEIKTWKKPRRDGRLIAIGRLKSGRNLEVVYRLKSETHYYVITAYDIEDKETLIYLEDLIEDYYGKNYGKDV